MQSLFYKKGKEQMEQLGKLLDEHIDWEKGESTGGGGQDDKDNKDKKKGPTYSKEELEQIKNEIKESEKLRNEAKTLLDNSQTKLDNASNETNKIIDQINFTNNSIIITT